MKRNDILYAKRVLRGMHPLYNLEAELCLPFAYPLIMFTKKSLSICGGGTKVAEEN